MAVIVLKGADFSSNNIGTIDLKKPFTSTTKRMLGYYGITVDEDDDFQNAFNNFIIEMTDAGVLAKVKGLCLPFMANVAQSGSLTYAQKNAINGENFFDGDISGKLSLNSNGLKAIIGGSVAKAKMIGVVSDFTSFHYGAYNITAEEKEYSGNIKTIYGSTGKALWLVKWDTYNKPEFWTDDPRIYGDTNYCAASCLILASVNASKGSLVVNGQIASDSPITFRTGAAANPPLLQYQGETYLAETPTSSYGYASAASWALFTIGDLLTDTECVQYNNAVNKLMEAVRTYL